MLIMLILTAVLLEAGAIIGGVSLFIMVKGVYASGRVDAEDIQALALMLIAIAICLVGAIHVMPA